MKMEGEEKSRDDGDFVLLLDEPDLNLLPKTPNVIKRKEKSNPSVGLIKGENLLFVLDEFTASKSGGGKPLSQQKTVSANDLSQLAKKREGKKLRPTRYSPTPPLEKSQAQSLDDILLLPLNPRKKSNVSKANVEEKQEAFEARNEKEAKLIFTLTSVTESIKKKQALLTRLKQDLDKMKNVFDKLLKMQRDKLNPEPRSEEEDQAAMTYKDRLEALEKGPFNIVFHGIEPDWIEQEMADDDDFKKDVLEQRIKKIIKDEAGMARDFPLNDVYRLNDGPRLRGIPPVVVSFVSRKDKEHVMWRAKEKLRKLGIFATEDSATRLAKLREEQEAKSQQQENSRFRGGGRKKKVKN